MGQRKSGNGRRRLHTRLRHGGRIAITGNAFDVGRGLCVQGGLRMDGRRSNCDIYEHGRISVRFVFMFHIGEIRHEGSSEEVGEEVSAV